MMLVNYLFPVYAFIIGSGSLCIPPGQLEHVSRELTRPNTLPMSADVVDKKKSWPSHVVEPRVQHLAMLVKRTTDEESPNSQKNVEQGKNAIKGPVIGSSEQLPTYQEEYNAALSALTTLGEKLGRAKAAGLEPSRDDVDELSRLKAVTSQRRLVLTKARQVVSGDRQSKPATRRGGRRRQDTASLVHNPEIQELARSGDYSAQQLAEYKRNFLDALTEFRSTEQALAKVAKVRKVTEVEEKELADFHRAYNHHRKVWNRVRQNKPADYRADRPKKSMDDLLESAKLHEMAQSSGYSVEELAEAQRRYLNSINKASAFKRELAGVKRVRKVTLEEETQLKMLLRAAEQQRQEFYRMCRGRPADGRAYRPLKDVTSLLKDPEIQRIAELGGYRVEEVAVHYRGLLDAKHRYRAAQKSILAVKEEGGTLQKDVADSFLEIDKAYQLQKTGWNRMRKGERVDPAIQPIPKVGRLGRDVKALRPNDPANQPSPTVERVGHGVAALRQNDSEDRRSATYTAEQVAAYNEDHLDALSKLRAFQRKMAAAGHPPTADDTAQERVLRGNYNEKKTIWNRARTGKPLDRRVHNRRPGSGPESTESQETRPGSQEEASQAIPAKGDSSTTHQPFQISGPRHLLAPVLSSARDFLQGVGRQWRAMPWTRYLANPRLNLNSIKPAEVLRVEQALP
ncbi:MAG: hypothetical protein M1826_006755 [Phylliscum demangeonii]|nr:MAG: hypothetical protein M1826_006755 [Phylliscum demangeonii]